MKLARAFTIATLIAASLPVLTPVSALSQERLQRPGTAPDFGTSTYSIDGSAFATPPRPAPSYNGAAGGSRPLAGGVSRSGAYNGVSSGAYDGSVNSGGLSGSAVDSSSFASFPRQTFTAPISQAPLNVQQPTSAPATRPSFSATLSQQDLALLGSRDVVVLIDKSGSMGDMDCPAPMFGGGSGGRIASKAVGMFGTLAGAAAGFGGISIGGPGFGVRGAGPGVVSRWEWAGAQLTALAGATSGVLPKGITAMFFDNSYQVFPNVRVQQIPQLFAREHPSGSTDVTGALKACLVDYFKRKAADPAHTKPLVVAVITDGMPNNENSLKNLIVNTSNRMARPDEIAITFLQVGRERDGLDLLHELDDGMQMRGAQFDIVDSKVFPEVARFGLSRALVLAITERTNEHG